MSHLPADIQLILYITKPENACSTGICPLDLIYTYTFIYSEAEKKCKSMILQVVILKNMRVVCNGNHWNTLQKTQSTLQKDRKKIIKVYKKLLNIITITIIITAHYYTYYLRPKFWRVIFRFKIVSFSALQVSLM